MDRFWVDETCKPTGWNRVSPLVVVVISLSLASLGANLLWLRDIPLGGGARLLLSVDEETSIPTWWCVVIQAGLGLLAWNAGVRRVEFTRGERLAWAVLAGGFVFLSLDDATMLHERFGSQLHVDGTFHHARWIVLWLPLGLGAGSLVLWRLWRSARRTVIGLMLGAGIYLSGAVGTEIVNTVNRRHSEWAARDAIREGGADPESMDRTGKRNLPYIVGTAVEEALEMLGMVVWFGVMLRARDEIEGARPG